MLLLPLLSRIFAVLQAPVTGTDEDQIHRRLKEAYLSFFIGLMNANLDGVFVSDRNKPEFENLLSALLTQALDPGDMQTQRFAWAFFARSVIAWGTSPAASVFAESALSDKAGPTNLVPEDRAAVPGYQNFIYQRLLPACFEAPANPAFNIRGGQPVSWNVKRAETRFCTTLPPFSATLFKPGAKKRLISSSPISCRGYNAHLKPHRSLFRACAPSNPEISARRLPSLSERASHDLRQTNRRRRAAYHLHPAQRDQTHHAFATSQICL